MMVVEIRCRCEHPWGHARVPVYRVVVVVVVVVVVAVVALLE